VLTGEQLGHRDEQSINVASTPIILNPNSNCSTIVHSPGEVLNGHTPPTSGGGGGKIRSTRQRNKKASAAVAPYTVPNEPVSPVSLKKITFDKSTNYIF
jgi:hypothetical protein